jgi:hypothetical protein
MNFENVKRALSSIKMHPPYIEICVPTGNQKESISFYIKIVDNKLEQAVADITDSNGIPIYSGFIAPDMQPMCPIYKHS